MTETISHQEFSMKKSFVAPALREESTLARLTLRGCTSVCEADFAGPL